MITRSSQQVIFFSLILLFHAECSLIFESSFKVTAFGTVFQARHPSELLLTLSNSQSLMRCLMQCNQNLQCRTINYDQSSQMCQLFAGELSTGTLINNASLPFARVGAVRFNTESVSQSYTSYNQTCDRCTSGKNRYVQCWNSTCQCPSQTFWNGQMCQNKMYNGSSCLVSTACREDLNFTCFNRTRICRSTAGRRTPSR
jgi:hypothetical protein